jgi:hypothetical protein
MHNLSVKTIFISHVGGAVFCVCTVHCVNCVYSEGVSVCVCVCSSSALVLWCSMWCVLLYLPRSVDGDEGDI